MKCLCQIGKLGFILKGHFQGYLHQGSGPVVHGDALWHLSLQFLISVMAVNNLTRTGSHRHCANINIDSRLILKELLFFITLSSTAGVGGRHNKCGCFISCYGKFGTVYFGKSMLWVFCFVLLGDFCVLGFVCFLGLCS